jgi:hypothetical protein
MAIGIYKHNTDKNLTKICNDWHCELKDHFFYHFLKIIKFSVYEKGLKIKPFQISDPGLGPVGRGNGLKTQKGLKIDPFGLRSELRLTSQRTGSKIQKGLKIDHSGFEIPAKGQ